VAQSVRASVRVWEWQWHIPWRMGLLAHQRRHLLHRHRHRLWNMCGISRKTARPQAPIPKRIWDAWQAKAHLSATPMFGQRAKIDGSVQKMYKNWRNCLQFYLLPHHPLLSKIGWNNHLPHHHNNLPRLKHSTDSPVINAVRIIDMTLQREK
jgi:hypothetical protein